MADIELNDADRAIIEVLREGRNTPSNIAQERDYTREYIANRIKRLLEHEVVDRVGRGLYELAEDPDRDRITTSGLPQSPETTPREPDEAAEHPGETSPEPQDGASIEPDEPVDAPDALVDSLQDVEFPKSRDQDDCVEAVAAAYRYLQDRGKATMRMFVNDVAPDHPVGYEVPRLEEGERYRGGWWRSVVRPGLSAIQDVQAPQGQDRWWRHCEGS